MNIKAILVTWKKNVECEFVGLRFFFQSNRPMRRKCSQELEQ